jgi:hypothetical protein
VEKTQVLDDDYGQLFLTKEEREASKKQTRDKWA